MGRRSLRRANSFCAFTHRKRSSENSVRLCYNRARRNRTIVKVVRRGSRENGPEENAGRHAVSGRGRYGGASVPGVEKTDPLPYRFRAGLFLPLNHKAMTADVRGDLVSREREMGLLAGYRRKAAGGHGAIVLLGGEAGVGKSRLLRQFESSVGVGRSMLAFSRCVEFVQAPLGPLRELLQSLDRRGATPRDGATRAVIERLTFERHADGTTAQHSGWLFESIDAAFARYALRGTVILLIEDAHWADRSTLGFLAYLADRIGERRMLVVATYRSDEVGGDHPHLSDLAALLAKSTVSNINVSPLDERSTHALIELAMARPDALDAATVAGIVRRSQGNPFFAEELVKNALEWGASDDQESLPLSIRGAVLARAALLSEEQRRILSLAAVLGERFSVDRLVALSSAPRDDVLRALERAHALHLVYDRRIAFSPRAHAGGALRRTPCRAGSAAARGNRPRTRTAA